VCVGAEIIISPALIEDTRESKCCILIGQVTTLCIYTFNIRSSPPTILAPAFRAVSATLSCES